MNIAIFIGGGFAIDIRVTQNNIRAIFNATPG